jgi:hypothetical protein
MRVGIKVINTFNVKRRRTAFKLVIEELSLQQEFSKIAPP